MADQKTEAEIAAEKDATDAAAAKAKADADASGGDDKDGLRRALAKQATEKDAENAKLAKQIAAFEKEKLTAKEAKMIEDGKLNDLIAERDKTIAEMTATAATSTRSLLESSARDHLRNLGMSDALYLQGALAGLPADATTESVEEWAKLMKADNATAFTAPVVTLGQSSVGPPATDAGSANWKDIEAQTKSDDPKERKQARDKMTAYYQEHGKFPD